MEDSKAYGTMEVQACEAEKTPVRELMRRVLSTMMSALAGCIVIGSLQVWLLRSSPSAAGDVGGAEMSLHAIQVNVSNVTIPMEGLQCDNATRTLVVYPNDDANHPLVVFAPGDFRYVVGWDVQTRYVPLIQGVAEAGFIVVSPLATGGWCEDAAYDQLHVVSYVKEHSADHDDSWLWGRVDFEPGVGILGISMGGLAVIENAGLQDGTITAAASIAPFWDGYHEMINGLDKHPIHDVVKPMLLIAGDVDFETPWAFVQSLYYSLPVDVPRAFSVFHNYTHTNIRLSPGSITLCGLWFGCMMRHAEFECAIVESLSDGNPIAPGNSPGMSEIREAEYTEADLLPRQRRLNVKTRAR